MSSDNCRERAAIFELGVIVPRLPPYRLMLPELLKHVGARRDVDQSDRAQPELRAARGDERDRADQAVSRMLPKR